MTKEEFFERFQYDINRDKVGDSDSGSVYKAYDTQSYRFVALKITKINAGNQHENGNNDNESDNTYILPTHPNIAGYEFIYVFEQPTGLFEFAIMPFYQLGNLKQLLEKFNLRPEDKASIGIQVLDGIEFLHQHGIVHKNLKPENILIDIENSVDGTVYTAKISDSSTQSRNSSSRYSQYQSPEQLRNRDLTPNTDLWSWAVICYKLLTGNDLFETNSQKGEIGIMMSILDEDITPKLEKLPYTWKVALYETLKRDANQRVQTAKEIKNIILNTPAMSEYGSYQPATDADDYIAEEEEELEVMLDEEEEEEEFKSKPEEREKETADSGTSKKKNRAWIFLLFIFIIAAAYYLASNSQIFKRNISESKAREIIMEMMDVRSNGNYDQVVDIFANPTEKYFSEENINRKNIIADMEKFSETWTFEDVKITEFGRTVENMFHFTMTYNLRDRKSLQITPYKVSGEVGYVKEDDMYKINYVANRNVTNERATFSYSNVSTQKQQDFTDYKLSYYGSLLFLPDVKDEYLLNYIYADLLDVNFAGYGKQQLQQALQDDYIEFINFSEKNTINFFGILNYEYNKQVEMSIAFVDANLLSLQIVKNIKKGMDLLSKPDLSVAYKNMDYTEGKTLTMNDVLNTNSTPWTDLLLNAFDENAVTANNKRIDKSQISSLPGEPGNFYFDTKKLFLVYGKNEIPEAAELGPITVALPYSQIGNYLNNHFKEMINNSRKVNIKKL